MTATARLARTSAIACAAAIMAAAPSRAWACTSCVGTTDSSLFAGMNLGVLTLAGVTLLVLGAFGAFFVRLARLARRTAPPTLTGGGVC